MVNKYLYKVSELSPDLKLCSDLMNKDAELMCCGSFVKYGTFRDFLIDIQRSNFLHYVLGVMICQYQSL